MEEVGWIGSIHKCKGLVSAARVALATCFSLLDFAEMGHEVLFLSTEKTRCLPWLQPSEMLLKLVSAGPYPGHSLDTPTTMEMLDSFMQTIHSHAFKQTWAAGLSIHKVFNSTFLCHLLKLNVWKCVDTFVLRYDWIADVALHQFSFNLSTWFGCQNWYIGTWKPLDMPLIRVHNHFGAGDMERWKCDVSHCLLWIWLSCLRHWCLIQWLLVFWKLCWRLRS